jgi:hypothetical protein
MTPTAPGGRQDLPTGGSAVCLLQASAESRPRGDGRGNLCARASLPARARRQSLSPWRRIPPPFPGCARREGKGAAPGLVPTNSAPLARPSAGAAPSPPPSSLLGSPDSCAAAAGAKAKLPARQCRTVTRRDENHSLLDRNAGMCVCGKYRTLNTPVHCHFCCVYSLPLKTSCKCNRQCKLVAVMTVIIILIMMIMMMHDASLRARRPQGGR